MEMKYNKKYVNKTVDDNLLNFLKRCYTVIPYRNSTAEIRNIPYVVLKTSHSIEDNFLTFYRFIECYYKKTHPNAQKNFISLGLLEHYSSQHSLSEDQIEKYTKEIIRLRNHYVHSGYYIKNSSLRISFGKGDPKNYTANADFYWIYERAKILYEVTVNIIFIDMLGYNTHQFKKHF